MKLLCAFNKWHPSCAFLQRLPVCIAKEIRQIPKNRLSNVSTANSHSGISSKCRDFRQIFQLRSCFTFSSKTNNLHCIQTIRNYAKSRLPFEADTNVSKDVLLFSHPNDTFYKMLSFFGVVQFLFWSYLARFSYKTLRDTPNTGGEVKLTDIRSWKNINLGSNMYRNGIVLLCMSVGEYRYIICIKT